MTLQGLGRKLFLVLLGLVGCVLLVVALLPYVVSLDSVRDQIVGRIEAALHRKVAIGEVRLQLLSGLGAGLEDVTIYNPPGWQQPYVMKAATLSIKLAWRPFLQRRIEITKLILQNGDIVIERNAQGHLNIADDAGATPVSTQTLPTDGSVSPSGDGRSASSHTSAWTAGGGRDVAEYVDHLRRSPDRSRAGGCHGGQRLAAASA